MPCSWRDPQLRVELARAVERDHLVAAADMLAIDEDLRDGPAAMRALDHLGQPPRLFIEADLGVVDALLLQQRAGPRAIGTPPRCIHLNLRHRRPAPKSVPSLSSRASGGGRQGVTVGHIWRSRAIWQMPSAVAPGCYAFSRPLRYGGDFRAFAPPRGLTSASGGRGGRM